MAWVEIGDHGCVAKPIRLDRGASGDVLVCLEQAGGINSCFFLHKKMKTLGTPRIFIFLVEMKGFEPSTPTLRT